MALFAAKGLKGVAMCSTSLAGSSKVLASAVSLHTTQVATLKHMHGEKYPYLTPYPYEKRDITRMECMWENTMHRICEQSKIITIDGNVGVGKHTFAKRMAKEFDLKYVPGLANDDLWVIPYNGFNLRELNDAFFDKDNKMIDLKELFNESEIDQGRIARLQHECQKKRYLQYMKGILHLLSTGQGFVTVRDPFSEHVFGNALKQLGWITPQYYNYHTKEKTLLLAPWVYTPHLNIYLDAPVDVCLKNIQEKSKNNPNYPAGPLLSADFLSAVEESYKPYLAYGRKDHEVLVLDWAEAGDESELEVIWEAISEIKLEPEDYEERRFIDYQYLDEDKITAMRWELSHKDKSGAWQALEDSSAWDAPEFLTHHETQEERWDVFKLHPSTKTVLPMYADSHWKRLLLGKTATSFLGYKSNF